MASPATLEPTYDGEAYGLSATYATARDVCAGVGATGTSAAVGQRWLDPNFNCNECGFAFDTGTELPDNATVTVATFKLYGKTDSSDTDFIINVHAFDFGETITGSDYRTAAQLAALTPLLASYNTSAGWAIDAYNVFTSTGDFLAAINKTGITYLWISSNRHAAGTQPSGLERVVLYMNDDATRKPQLYLEYTVPAAGNPYYSYAQQ